MRILLITDDSRARLALQFYLSSQPDVVLVGAVDHNADPALLVAGTWPDLVILDWDSHQPTAVKLLAALRSTRYQGKIMVLSGDSDVEQAALAAGADMFISKGEPPAQLLLWAHRLCAPRRHSDDLSASMP